MSNKERQLEGRVAVVTGGSAGLGRATCLALAAEGARLAIVGRNRQRLEETSAQIAENAAGAMDVITLCLDVTCEKDMAAMAREALRRWDRIDILVHSAGILRAGEPALRRIDQTPVSEWDEVIRTNLRGTFLANRAVLEAMIRQRAGDILNLSSKSGRRGLAFDGPYCASKFGVIGLTESIAEEVRPYGVRVQVLLPGTFQTPVWSQAGPLPTPAELPPAGRVAQTIVHMLKMPADSYLLSPIIEPTDSPAESGWRGRRGSQLAPAGTTPSWFGPALRA